jgi:hypothetical protein
VTFGLGNRCSIQLSYGTSAAHLAYGQRLRTPGHAPARSFHPESTAPLLASDNRATRRITLTLPPSWVLQCRYLRHPRRRNRPVRSPQSTPPPSPPCATSARSCSKMAANCGWLQSKFPAAAAPPGGYCSWKNRVRLRPLWRPRRLRLRRRCRAIRAAGVAYAGRSEGLGARWRHSLCRRFVGGRADGACRPPRALGQPQFCPFAG